MGAKNLPCRYGFAAIPIHEIAVQQPALTIINVPLAAGRRQELDRVVCAASAAELAVQP
jgi:hypothetical protein